MPMALDAALETLALGDPRHIDPNHFRQLGHTEGLAQLVGMARIQPELVDGPQRVGACLAEMALHGHGRVLGLLGAETKLHGAVAVTHQVLDLGNDARSGLDDRDGHAATIFLEGPRHAQLLADQSDHFYCSLATCSKSVTEFWR